MGYHQDGFAQSALFDEDMIPKLNSMTKYPSIPTYHQIDRGILSDKLELGDGYWPSSEEDIFVSEKIDGTNSRVLLGGEDYIIGSREEFLHARGDRFYNPTQGIVEIVRPVAQVLSLFAHKLVFPDDLLVLYGEAYGGATSANAKEYSRDKKTGFRIFDVMYLPGWRAKEKLAGSTTEQIASWRQHGGQTEFFRPVSEILMTAHLISEKTVPPKAICRMKDIPVSRAGAYEWLKQFKNSDAVLDAGNGQAEGVVIRTADRRFIRKLRFEDYEKTKRKNGGVL